MKLLKKLFGKIYFPIAWTLVVLILLTLPGSMLPNESNFKIPQFDKFVHCCLFGGFVFLWCLYVSTKPFTTKERLIRFCWIFFSAIVFGISMEYVQKYFIPFREFELGDIIADMMGASLAYGLCTIWMYE